MGTLDLIASLEADRDESEEKQAAKHKTHSSLCTIAAAPAAPKIEITTRSEKEDNESLNSHNSCCTSQSKTNNRNKIYAELEDRVRLLATEDAQIQEDETTTSRTERHYGELRKVRNENMSGVNDGRLMKGANNKRGFSDADLDVFQNFRQSRYRQSDIKSALYPNEGVATEEDFDAACKGARDQPPGAHYVRFEVGHAVSRMPGRSPGRKRKQRSPSREPISPQDITDDLGSLPTLEEAVLEIADSQEERFVGIHPGVRKAVVGRLG